MAWKDINQKYKNDFEAALEYVLKDMTPESLKELGEYTESLVEAICNLNLKKLGERVIPPEGY